MLNRYIIQDIDLYSFLSDQVDTDGDGLINNNEFRTLATIAKVDKEILHECVFNTSRDHEDINYYEKETHNLSYGQITTTLKIDAWPSIDLVMKCELIKDGLQSKIDRKQFFQMHKT